MFEGLKEALQYVNGLKEESMQPIVTEIAGKTYCNKDLRRYGMEDLADAIHVNTLSAMVDYITGKSEELREKMILHIVSPKEVSLYSGLLEERNRETLFVCDAIVNEFQFDKYYDQERFLIELQANFAESDDLKTIMQVAGNIQAGTTASYSDDGISQKTTIKTGVQRVDVQAADGIRFEKGTPVTLRIVARFEPPKSASRKRQQQMLSGELPPLKKPDIDNIVKVVADALNGAAYHDDTQIIFVIAKKAYSAVEGLDITVEEYTDGR